MKISKLFANTLQSKTDLIFFAAIAAYNLLLGFYLKDFFVLSPMLLAFYLLSALPTLFFVIRIRSNAMRAIVYILLIFVLGLSAVSFVCCRRFLTIMTMLEMVVMLMYLALSYDSSDKDKLLTKIYVLAVEHLSLQLFSPRIISSSNRRLRIFPTAEIPCGTHKRKNLLTKFVWAVILTKKKCKHSISGLSKTLNTTMNAIPLSSTLMFARHCEPSKVYALILLTCSPRSAGVKTSLAMPLTEYPVRIAQIGTLGIEFTLMALGGT